MIMPIERRRLSDAVVDQLSELITNGTYPLGEKLPSERDLAKSLGVSRALVRESFRILESLGLVEVRPGVGAIVANNSPKTVDIANYLWNHHAKVIEVLDVRDTLAARASGLAASRMTDAELQQLQEIYVAQHAASQSGAVEELVQLDEEFHSLIYQAARNSVLLAMQDYSRSVLNNIQWNALTLATRRAKSLAEHGQIVAALVARDPELAENASRFHAQQSNSEIRKLLERRMNNSVHEDSAEELEEI
jgi:GntR family transcriptional regulator, transcriptional repressor for pyruvate dehydrogenase complex